MNNRSLRFLQRLQRWPVFWTFALVLTLLSPFAALAQKAYIPTGGSSGTVSVINTATGTLCTASTCVSTATYPIPVGSGSQGVAVSSDGSRAYITNAGSNSVSIINTSIDSVIATVTVGNFPFGVAVLPNGSAVYVVNQGDKTISVISTSSNTVTATISLPSGISKPGAIAASPDGLMVYVTTASNPPIHSQLIAINTSTNVASGSVITDLGVGVAGLAVSPDGSKAFASSNNGLVILSTPTGSPSSTVTVAGGGGLGVAVSPDGSTVYLAAGNLATINGSTVTYTTVGTAPEGVSLTADGSEVYVVNNGGTVSEVSTSTLNVLNTVTVGGGPLFFGVFITPPSPMSGKQLGPKSCHCSAADGSSTLTSLGAASAGEPIDIASGNMSYKVTDYSTAGRNPLALTRYYNSRASTFSTFAGTFGVNWRSTFDRYIQIHSSSQVTVERAGGQQLNFTLSGSTWIPDSDVDLTLTNSGTTWTLTDSDDTVETYTATTAGNEALVNSIKARDGYTQTLTYTSNQLTSVSDSYSRSLSFTYNTNGTLHTVTTPDSTTLTYGYNAVTGGNQLTSVAYSTSPVTSQTYVYANTGLPFALTGITDENGNTYMTWTYDTLGRGLTSQQGSGANLTTLAYNSNGTTTVTNPLGVTDTYTFTTLQGVRKVTQISRAATSTTAAASETITYDSNGYVASLTDWNGNQTTYVNNSHGLPTTINEAVGSSVARTTTTVYDPTFVHLPDSVTTPGLTTSFTHDASGNVLTRTLTDTTTATIPYSTNGQTRTTTFTYDSTGHVLTAKSPNSNTTHFGYDTSGALTSITDALTHATNITSHTAGGRPLTIVDPNSVTSTLTYTPRQWLLSSSVSTSGGARTTTYTYDAAGNLTKTTLPDSSYLASTFDSAHRITKVTDALGSYTSYTLDALGDRTLANIYDSSNSLWRQHSSTFDSLGRMLTDVGGSVTRWTYTYDPNGNRLTSKDGNNNTTTRVFDALNRLSTSTDANTPTHGVTSYAYDAHDRPLTVTDANSHATSYVYGGFGDKKQQVSPDSGTTVYHYDSDANLTQKLDALSVVTNYTYDALDRITSRSYPADGTQYVGYTYDATGFIFFNGIGRLTTLTDAAGAVNYGYDERGNATYVERTSGSNHFYIFPSYDAASRPSGVTYPSGLFAGYNRDAAGNINQVTIVPSGSSTAQTVAWPAFAPFYGPLRYLTSGNNVGDYLEANQDYQTKLFQVITTAGNLTNQTYTYDNANNLTGVSDTVSSYNNQTLGYDSLNRLTSATSGTGGYGSFSWTYDKVSNRLTQTLGSATTTYGYTSGTNRLASITSGGTITVSTNANGNITSVPPAGSSTAATFAYNVANRLSSVTGSPLAISSLLYDGVGRRFSKQNPGSNPTYYTYDLNGNLLEENDNGAVTDYIYLNGTPVGTFVPSTGALYYIHGDRQGTPQFVTNSSQAVVWSTLYQPLGTTTVPIGSITQNLRFPGQYFDGETGFNYNLNRDYMPNLGRFPEADPIGLAGGLNPYLYANANPGKFTDPSGTDPNDHNSQASPLSRANQIIAPAVMGDILDPSADSGPSVLSSAEEIVVTGGADVVAGLTYNDLLPGGPQQADTYFNSGLRGAVLRCWFGLDPIRETAPTPPSPQELRRIFGPPSKGLWIIHGSVIY
jgi:RHS repeat-associated protein